ncbi:MAG: KEOPS complex subunit Pcc1 [Candidatus Baldrarchaeia archaeon]
MNDSNSALLEVTFKEEKHAQIAFQAILQETTRMTGSRSQSSLTVENKRLVLDIESKDLTSLRATLNSYLKWFLIIKNILQIVELERIEEEE